MTGLTVPAIPIEAAGQPNTAALFNAAVGGTMALQQTQCMCELFQATAQSIPTGASTPVNWDSEELDPFGFHSTTANVSRITPVVPGRYMVAFGGGVVGNATGNRGAFLRLNGATYRGGGWYGTGSADTVDGTYTRTVYCNGAGDYFETVLYQSSGAALLTNLTDGNPRVSVFWVGTS